MVVLAPNRSTRTWRKLSKAQSNPVLPGLTQSNPIKLSKTQ